MIILNSISDIKLAHNLFLRCILKSSCFNGHARVSRFSEGFGNSASKFHRNQPKFHNHTSEYIKSTPKVRHSLVYSIYITNSFYYFILCSLHDSCFFCLYYLDHLILLTTCYYPLNQFFGIFSLLGRVTITNKSFLYRNLPHLLGCNLDLLYSYSFCRTTD